VVAGAARTAAAAMPWEVVPAVLEAARCRLLTASLARRPALPARIGAPAGDRADPEVRRGGLRWVARDLATLDVFGRLASVAETVNRTRFGFALDPFPELMQCAEYGPGDHYDWHRDVGEPAAGARPRPELARRLSLTVQLSDDGDYAGGDLEIRDGAETLRAGRSVGTVVLFPSTALHRVAPVTSGTRFALVAWLTGPAEPGAVTPA